MTDICTDSPRLQLTSSTCPVIIPLGVTPETPWATSWAWASCISPVSLARHAHTSNRHTTVCWSLSNSSSRVLLAGSRGNLQCQTHNSTLSDPCTSHSPSLLTQQEYSPTTVIASHVMALQSPKNVSSIGKSLQGTSV